MMTHWAVPPITILRAEATSETQVIRVGAQESRRARSLAGTLCIISSEADA